MNKTPNTTENNLQPAFKQNDSNVEATKKSNPVSEEAVKSTDNTTNRRNSAHSDNHYYGNRSYRGKYHNNMQNTSYHHKKQNVNQNWQNNQYYRPYYPPNTYGGMGGNTFTGQSFITQPSVSKAIPIINPNTSQVVKLSGQKESKPEDSAKEPIKIATPPSRAIKIVDPKQLEAEKKAKEEAEQKAKEEAEQKAREEAQQKAREEAEQKAKEEAEQKAKEEAEQKAKEEAERQAREEAEKKAREEAEQKAKEEAEQKAKEEAELKAKQEAETRTDENEEERIAAIAAEKAAKGIPGRLDISAIPAHVFHESPASSPTSASTPKIKRPPMPVIQDFSTIEYPPEFLAPTVTAGKLKYEAAFLLQFQKLCLDTDEDLSELHALTINSNTNDNKRSNSRRQGSERGRGPRTPGGSGDFSRNNSREMGKFGSGRQLSHRQGSNGPNSPNMERQGSKRGGRGGKGRHPTKDQSGGPTIPLDQVVPLEKSENRWVPTVVATDGVAATASEVNTEAEVISQEVIIRKVKSLLNKLTLEKFDSISNQIWEFAKQSEKEENGQSLRTVIQLVFDKAIDEPNFAGMWAQLCTKMYELISNENTIKDMNILDKNREPVSGGPLYRKYLLNRCQQEFEKGWKTDLLKFEADPSSDIMLTDEYYAAVKAKRQGLGLVQFIGELFKRQMLTDRVMMECLVRLCTDPSHPEEEETETMCKLLTTIGRSFEFSSKKNKEWLDVYFEKMNEMYRSETISSRVKFMILDVFDLRRAKWVDKRAQQAGPTTIAQIHEQAKKASEEKEKEAMKRTGSARGNPMSRQGSRAGHNISRQNSSANNNKQAESNNNAGADGWNTVGTGGPATTAKSGRVNELANFGKTRTKSRNSVLGPSSSPFSSLSRSGSKTGLDKKPTSTENQPSSPATSMSNMFSALGGDEEPVERKKLQLLPRNSDDAEDSETHNEEEGEAVSEPEEVAEEDDKPKLSDEVIERRSKNTIEEYFNLRDKTELCECVKELDHTHYRVIFARKLLDVVEKKAEDVEIVCEMIEVLYKDNLVTREEYVEAFKLFWEIYEDLVIDVPKAPAFVDKLLKAAGIERSEVECEPSY